MPVSVIHNVVTVYERSKGLLRKLGFTHEGALRRRFFFRNRLLKEEWVL